MWGRPRVAVVRLADGHVHQPQREPLLAKKVPRVHDGHPPVFNLPAALRDPGAARGGVDRRLEGPAAEGQRTLEGAGVV